MVKRRVVEKESFYAFWVNLQRMKTKGCKKGRQRLTQGQTHTHTHTLTRTHVQKHKAGALKDMHKHIDTHKREP